MLRTAREEAGLSREAASFRLHVGSRTLASYERGETLCPPDVMVSMSRLYEKPEMLNDYCSDTCPIGQIMHHKCQRRDIATSVLSVVKEFEDVKQVIMNLISVSADGKITPDELPVFQQAIAELLELEKAITEIKLAAARNAGLDLAELMGSGKGTSTQVPA